jgi:hypothetical protein
MSDDRWQRGPVWSSMLPRGSRANRRRRGARRLQRGWCAAADVDRLGHINQSLKPSV